MDARTNLLLETLDSAGVSANVYRTAMRLWHAAAQRIPLRAPDLRRHVPTVRYHQR